MIHTETESSEPIASGAYGPAHVANELQATPATWTIDANPSATCAVTLSSGDRWQSKISEQRESPFAGDVEEHEAEETLVLEAAINGSVQSPDYSLFYLGMSMRNVSHGSVS